IFYFFFQAEDGIRDRNVTGVQTCALPIWPHKPQLPARLLQASSTGRRDTVVQFVLEETLKVLGLSSSASIDTHQPLRELGLDSRSEERRVGKECRSRWLGEW